MLFFNHWWQSHAEEEMAVWSHHMYPECTQFLFTVGALEKWATNIGVVDEYYTYE